MKITDLVGFGKVFEKLIDVISKGTGTVTSSYFLKKKANAKAYGIVSDAKANAEAIKITAFALQNVATQIGNIEIKDGTFNINAVNASQSLQVSNIPTIEITERTQDRISYQQERRQGNIEAVTSFAANELLNDTYVSDEPVNEDFINRFFKVVEDVSNEEMQMLWGKILAGEIRRPNSFSLRTLELIKNLSKDEAELIMKVGNFGLCTGKDFVTFKGGNLSGGGLIDCGITFEEISTLRDIGILQSGDSIHTVFEKSPIEEYEGIIYGKYVLLVSLGLEIPKVSIPVYSFTRAGSEIMKLVDVKPDFKYMLNLAIYFKERGANSIKYSTLEYTAGDNGKPKLPLLDFDFPLEPPLDSNTFQ